MSGGFWFIRRVHIHSDQRHLIGTGNPGAIAQAQMRRYDYDEVILKGPRRESGLRAGRFPLEIRYLRRPEPAA